MLLPLRAVASSLTLRAAVRLASATRPERKSFSPSAQQELSDGLERLRLGEGAVVAPDRTEVREDNRDWSG
jgi:hypothetical protein